MKVIISQLHNKYLSINQNFYGWLKPNTRCFHKLTYHKKIVTNRDNLYELLTFLSRDIWRSPLPLEINSVWYQLNWITWGLCSMPLDELFFYVLHKYVEICRRNERTRVLAYFRIICNHFIFTAPSLLQHHNLYIQKNIKCFSW